VAVAVGDVQASFTAMGRKVVVLDAISSLGKGQMLTFCTEGKWSSHELLAKLLHHTGPARVRISTYSMTEDPTRMLVNYVAMGQITDLKVVTDKRFQKSQAQVHQLAASNFPLVMADVHAKVIVLQNDDWNITVIGSANFTRNKRRESGIIIDSIDIANFHWKWIDEC